MKKALFGLFAGLMLLVGVGVGHGISQEKGKEPSSPDSEGGDSMEDAWMKLHEPGEEHKLLAKEVGDWNIEAKMWMEGVEEPVTMKGTSKITMLWDRYLHEEYTLGEGEMEFKGRGVIGYDNSNKEYTACYFASMGTSLHVLTGQREGDTTTLTGEWTEEGLNNLKVKQKVVSVAKDENTTVVTIYETYGDGPENKLMEMTYTRKK